MQMKDGKYLVEFSIEVDACSEMEALELAREGVMMDYADVFINGEAS